MAMFTPSPLTGPQTNSHNWLANIGVGNTISSHRFQSRPMLLANRTAACQPLTIVISTHKADSMATMRQANTSVPVIGRIHMPYRNSMENNKLDAIAASKPLDKFVISDGLLQSIKVNIVEKTDGKITHLF